MTSKVTERDHGARALLRAVRRKGGPVLRVGVIGDAAAARANDAPNLTVAALAEAHEFSIPRGQGRSFVRATIDEKAAAIREALRRAAREVVEGRMSPEQALSLLGLELVGAMKQKIISGIPPALSKEYLPRKLAKYPGATTPLIASGQLLASIGSEVVAK